MREVITLQLGNLSNYTATHFWNAQDSYFTYGDEERSLVDHDIHWRAGLGQDGQETFLPRTVVYDLKGGFGSSGKVNALCDPATTPGFDVTVDSLWSGPTAVHTQQAVDRKAYQQGLDDGTEPPWMTGSSVRYWSDFSSVCFHPKSVVHLHDFELGSTNRPFQRFASGVELFCSLDKEHGLIDRDWRPLVEECDVMQGMQIVNTLDDAWGGFASSYLEALRDEYPKSASYASPIQLRA
ncbi:hypothetical protein CDD83_4434 [Cordyceps sp. RAO-2017]|nr:hypothetical protein CDD83_4434 [Cordyceps sp. RAO-2017]